MIQRKAIFDLIDSLLRIYMERLKRNILITGLFCLLVISGTILVSNEKNKTVTVMSSSSWGLSFQEEGKPPVIDVKREELEALDGYYLGKEDENTIYLTFDAGYENGYTETILDALSKHNVKATFFLVGNYVERCPELAKRMDEEGHLIGNHTYHHKDMATITTKEAFLKELQDFETVCKEKAGVEAAALYRPPQGKYSKEHLTWAKENGYKSIFWSLAYVDWDDKKQPSKEEAIEKLTKRIHPGAIILLHSTSSTNAAIMDDILTKWEQMGYQFGTLSDL